MFDDDINIELVSVIQAVIMQRIRNLCCHIMPNIMHHQLEEIELYSWDESIRHIIINSKERNKYL